MKRYEIALKGTKKHTTSDITVEMFCDSKIQAFCLAYQFFQKAETEVKYGKDGSERIGKWMPDAENLKKYAGKYKVYRTSVICK